MGVIYERAEIERLGSLPTPEVHVEVGKEVVAVLGERLAGLPRVGFIAHGSVPEGRSNAFSDLDVFVVGRTEDLKRHAAAIGTCCRKLRGDTGVHIELKVESPDAFHDGSARMDALFAGHIVRSLNDTWGMGIQPEWFDRYLEASPDEVIGQVIGYGQSKVAKFATAKLSGEKSDLRVLQRALELPRAIRRKAAGYAIGVVNGDPSLDVLARRSEAYANMTKMFVDGEIGRTHYDYWIEDNYGPALDMAWLLSTRFVDQMRDLRENAMF